MLCKNDRQAFELTAANILNILECTSNWLNFQSCNYDGFFYPIWCLLYALNYNCPTIYFGLQIQAARKVVKDDGIFTHVGTEP